MHRFRMIAYPFGAAVAASFVVVLLGMLAFGFRLTAWSEWQGGVVGIFGTAGAVAAAALGAKIALRTGRHGSGTPTKPA